MATSIKQDAARLNMTLDAIWRSGDQDECSIKHISYATAALSVGLDWTDGLDYKTPFGGHSDWIEASVWGDKPVPERAEFVEADEWSPAYIVFPWTEGRIADETERLVARWSKVQAKRDEWGAARFDEVMRATKFVLAYESARQLVDVPAPAPRLTLVTGEAR